MNDEARRFWEMATSSPWVSVLLMVIAVASIVTVVYVSATQDFSGAVGFYGFIVVIAWFGYLLLLGNYYENIKIQERNERLWKVFVEAPKDQEWEVTFNTPNTLIIHYPNGHAYFLEIEDVKEVEA